MTMLAFVTKSDAEICQALPPFACEHRRKCGAATRRFPRRSRRTSRSFFYLLVDLAVRQLGECLHQLRIRDQVIWRSGRGSLEDSALSRESFRFTQRSSQ
jgi:hypothetical protein